ncbi:MAG: VWA domain-containing protein [Verrucomicrobiaceae bacterium]|nr:VWA domain-containing protein [Verrucomicrobiaceae bacterium]
MENHRTHLAYILDRSGSMQHLQEAAVAAFNDFLRSQLDVPGDATLSLVLFDDQYEVPFSNVSLEQLRQMTAADFIPRGSTALLDAIGRTITETAARLDNLPDEHKPSSVIFAIFTDGYENASRRYTSAHISDLIAEKRKQGWDFLFLAANQDAIATAAAMNIHAADTSAVLADEKGIRTTGGSFSRKVSALRKSKSAPDQLTQAEQEDLEKPMSDIVREEENKP